MTRLIQKIISALFRDKQDEGHFSKYLIKNSVQLFSLHCASLGLGFLSNYVLIRVVGINDYGLYVYIFNLLYLLANFCLAGTDSLLIKEISVYDDAAKYEELKGVIFFGITVAFFGSLIVSFASEMIITFTSFKTDLRNFNWIILSVFSLLMLSAIGIGQASLQALRKIILSHLAEKIVRPVLFTILVLGIFHVQKKAGITDLIRINLAAIAVTLLVTFIFFKKSISPKLKGVKPKFDVTGWSYSTIGFFLLGGVYILNSRVDIFLLGIFKGNGEVGTYNIVLKISETISFGIGIVNFVLAPFIAKLFANNETTQLQLLITRAARIVIFFSLPLVIAIFFLRGNILNFFRADFFNSRTALLILCCGQLVNILFGSVGTLLMMTGNQKFSIYALAVGTSFNIVFNIVLTPKYGIVGTAIATTGSLIIWNLLMYLFVRKRIGIYPTAFKIV